MSAQPSEPADPYSALELRVADLEQQMRHVLPAKIDATGYAVGLVHQDVRAVRDTLERQGIVQASHGERLEHLARVQGDHGEQLAAISETVAEILRRLPDPGDTAT